MIGLTKMKNIELILEFDSNQSYTAKLANARTYTEIFVGVDDVISNMLGLHHGPPLSLFEDVIKNATMQVYMDQLVDVLNDEEFKKKLQILRQQVSDHVTSYVEREVRTRAAKNCLSELAAYHEQPSTE